MLNISINRENAIVENSKLQCKWTIKTDEFFGNVYATLEKHFPDFECDHMGDYIAAYICKKIADKPIENPVTIFGCSEIGSSLYDLLMFIDNRDVLTPTLKDIETMRIQQRMTANYLPISILDKDGMRFEGLETVTHVMIAVLYYYAYNEYKLVRCKHCGKWFATKSLKTEYCQRVSPCFGTILKGKKEISCEQAVRNIRQNCCRLKNAIETKAQAPISAQLGDKDFLWEFDSRCFSLNQAQKYNPTAENLTAYYTFLQKTNKERAWLK